MLDVEITDIRPAEIEDYIWWEKIKEAHDDISMPELSR